MKAIDVLRNEGLTVNFARLLVMELGGDAGARQWTALALGRIGSVKAVPALTKALKDDWGWEVILRHCNNTMPALVPWFCKVLLEDESAWARLRVTIALGEIGSVKAVPALIKALLKDKDAATRRYAAEALGLIGSVKAVPALTKALKEDEDAEVREWAVWAVRKIEEKRA